MMEVQVKFYPQEFVNIISLEKSIKNNDYSFTHNVLQRIHFGFRNKKLFRDTFIAICDTNNIQILDLVINKVFQTLVQEKYEYYSLNVTTLPTLKKKKKKAKIKIKMRKKKKKRKKRKRNYNRQKENV